MKAYVISGPDRLGIDAITLADVPEPVAEPGHVLVKVHAAGLNPVDYKLAEGGEPDWTYPHILGLDVAGEIVAIGEGVEDTWEVGMRVAGHGDLRRNGCFAEYVSAPEYELALIPDDVPYTTAAGLLCGALTAYQTINRKPNLNLVRDVFLFSAFTGIAFSDIRNLTQKNLLKAEDGIWWIHSARRKTGTPFHIPLLDLPLELIAKYRGIAPNGRLFPMLSCSKTNINLKKIASICGIERRVTFHLARHTYASVITLSQGVPLDTVRELMGHRDWRATQIYAHLTNDKVSEDMGRLQERIGNKFELTDNKMAEVVISTPQIKRTKRMKP